MKQSAKKEDFELKKEYDFSEGIRGRFYRPKKVSILEKDSRHGRVAEETGPSKQSAGRQAGMTDTQLLIEFINRL